MAKFTQTYPTDLKYTEWLLISEHFPHNKMGRPLKWERWQIIDAILYVNRLPMAHVAQGFSAVAGGVWILLALEPLRVVGADQCSSG